MMTSSNLIIFVHAVLQILLIFLPARTISLMVLMDLYHSLYLVQDRLVDPDLQVYLLFLKAMASQVANCQTYPDLS